MLRTYVKTVTTLEVCSGMVQVDSASASPHSQHAQADTDLEPASVSDPSQEDMALAAAAFSLPAGRLSVHSNPLHQGASIQPLQQQQQQQQQHDHHLQQLQPRVHGGSSPRSSHAAVRHVNSSFTHAAEGWASQQDTSTSQVGSPKLGTNHTHGMSRSTAHGSGQAPNSPHGFRQAAAGQGSKHMQDEAEDQGAVALQHASSTSAMMSLAQQASQPSWGGHQSPPKRHSRLTGASTAHLTCTDPAYQASRACYLYRTVSLPQSQSPISSSIFACLTAFRPCFVSVVSTTC